MTAFKSVEIKVMPKEGMAFCKYFRDGKLRGGHVSGGPAVRVFEADGKVGSGVTNEIWTLAGDLQKRHVVKGPATWNAASRDKNHIIVTTEDGQELVVSWPFKGKPEDAQAKELSELLLKHHVGGW